MYRFFSLPQIRKASKDMVTLAARADTLNRVTRLHVEEVKWCPGCNRTLMLDQFTPLRLGVPNYRPYCNHCAPSSPHRRGGWVHSLVRTVWTSLRNLAVRMKKTRYGARSAESRVEWSVNPTTGAMKFALQDGSTLFSMSSSDALRLLTFLQSYEGTLKQHGEITPDHQQEMSHMRSGQTCSGSLELDTSVQAVLEPIQQSELRETSRF